MDSLVVFLPLFQGVVKLAHEVVSQSTKKLLMVVAVADIHSWTMSVEEGDEAVGIADQLIG